MHTLKDFLIWYSNLDLQPSCKALEKMYTFWKDKNREKIELGRKAVFNTKFTRYTLVNETQLSIIHSCLSAYA